MKFIMDNIDDLIESIDYKSQLIGRKQRLMSGVEKTRYKGILIGFLVTLVLIGLPILWYGG